MTLQMPSKTPETHKWRTSAVINFTRDFCQQLDERHQFEDLYVCFLSIVFVTIAPVSVPIRYILPFCFFSLNNSRRQHKNPVC